MKRNQRTVYVIRNKFFHIYREYRFMRLRQALLCIRFNLLKFTQLKNESIKESSERTIIKEIEILLGVKLTLMIILMYDFALF